MKIKNIDHIVIPVSDIDKSLHFYTEVLGMEADTSNNALPSSSVIRKSIFT
ncbi:VOC family protein [Bacteroides ovatus]|nr:VOC family protein [Bacteroides ovatus]